MATKTSPILSSAKSPAKYSFKIFKGFPKKHRKALKIAIVGDHNVGKSAFVVRYLTRRFIGDYCSSIENTYPHTALVDTVVTPLLVWDSASYSNEDDIRSRVEPVACWADAVIILYSVTDMSSYETALNLNKMIQQTNSAYDMNESVAIPIILVGNKNDLWHQRQVITDKACQEAKEVGFANYFEISVKESLDQVRIVFEEAIRRGNVTKRQRRGHQGKRILVKGHSTEMDLSEETSPDSEESVKPSILQTIKKKITSPKNSVTSRSVSFLDDQDDSEYRRSRSYTYSGKFQLSKRVRKLSVFEVSSVS